ncbi:MAG: antibiotic biosynthesis monooxygenase [Thermodesulfovibrionales bacterium]|jgi:quinol monooxygenase YgiN
MNEAAEMKRVDEAREPGEAQMIHSRARIIIPFKKLREALQILRSVRERTRFKLGCVSTNIYREVDLENVIIVEECWSGEEELEHHLRSDEYNKVLSVFDMASVLPEISFDRILTTTGFETIEKARTQQSERACTQHYTTTQGSVGS